MSNGITFNTLEDAKDYKKMKYEQGQGVRINKEGGKYKATITGEIPRTKETARAFVGSSSYPLLEGEKLPPVRTRRKLSKYGISYDIDPELTSILLELNRKGYKTSGSCAGHRDKGFITISAESARNKKETIVGILKKHGLKITDIEEHLTSHFFKFKPIGKILKANKIQREVKVK